MKKFKKIIAMLCAVTMALSVLSVSALAAEINETEPIVTTDSITSISLSENELIDTIVQPSVQPYGISEPSATWDLSLNNYQSTFEFDTQIFTNYKFKNHNGTIKVDIGAVFSGDIPSYAEDEYYYEVELWSPGLLGGKVVSKQLSFGKNRTVTFSNLKKSTNYYIVISQPYNHRHGVVSGNFVVYK